MKNNNGAVNALFNFVYSPPIFYSIWLLLAEPCLMFKTRFRVVTEATIPHIFQPPFILPATEKQLGTIIFLPGHGQKGHYWESELKGIHEPYLKIISPTPNKWPVSYHNNATTQSWYDFHGVGMPYIKEDAKGINTSRAYIHGLIEEEIKNGVPADHIVVSGYSQGGPLALYAGLSFPQRLGGIATFSTFDPIKRSFNETFNKVNKDIPILHCFLHKAPYAEEAICNNTVKILKTITKNGVYKTYPFTIGQEYIVESEWKDMKDFCAGIIKKK